MGSVRKLLRDYGMGSKKSEVHKQNRNPRERCIQEIKGTTSTILDKSGAQIWSWILYIAYVISILNCMAHRSLSWRAPHETEYGFMHNVAHLMEFEFWETILIVDEKTQFTNSL